LNVSISRSNISSGSVNCDFLRGFVFGIQYLYLLYSHMISVVKDCLGGSRWYCVSRLMLYCFQSHSSFVLEMVIKRFPIFVCHAIALCIVLYIVLHFHIYIYSFS
jgi:hypothetical protein